MLYLIPNENAVRAALDAFNTNLDLCGFEPIAFADIVPLCRPSDCDTPDNQRHVLRAMTAVSAFEHGFIESATARCLIEVPKHYTGMHVVHHQRLALFTEALRKAGWRFADSPKRVHGKQRRGFYKPAPGMETVSYHHKGYALIVLEGGVLSYISPEVRAQAERFAHTS